MSLVLEFAKIDRDMRENYINTVEVEKVELNQLLQRIEANREIIIKRDEVRKIVQEVMSQKEQLVVNKKESTTESDDSSESTGLESNNSESESEVSKGALLSILSYLSMSPDTEVSDNEPVTKKIKK